MTIAGYDAQKAANNLTIQHTVADVLESVIPERVTDIVVEEEEEEEEEGGRFQMKTAVGSVMLRYTVTVHDPLLTAERVYAQLVQAVKEGEMDASLRYFAAQFGATELDSGTFGEAKVTIETAQNSDSQQRFAVWEVALMAVGGPLFALVLLAYFLHNHRQKQVQPGSVAYWEQQKIGLA